MAQSHNEALARIRQYAEATRGGYGDSMDFTTSSSEARLERTIKDLQARVQQQEAALAKLRAASDIDIEQAAYASEDPREKLKQLLVVKDAYTRLIPTVPELPGKGSAVPALLATRNLQQRIQESKMAISSTVDQIAKREGALRREEASLHDAKLLTRALEDGIVRLRAQYDDRSQKTPAAVVEELVASKRAKTESYDKEMQRLGQAMNDFINDYVSAMIAAEELGGPVVGDMFDVENETLAAGFTKKGKAKSGKKVVSDKLRQRRIDQIWGTKVIEEDGGDDDEPMTEAEAADQEMRQLIEDLFATMSGPGGGKGYLELKRDSAASRFLIRAKIAQFHPKDAKKIRLIDFGKELDD
ncbi:unnamed protein product [Periconia digitata]|uniref:Uncharacterized protein n=1 Tax=Periconia digitata TaxID=1303443 RepID=A0A9W4ULR6_9PLEO|nr:unnamed protein product [Periconia digitata]